MKRILLFILVAMAGIVDAAQEVETAALPAKAPSAIELRDQFDAPQKLSFPCTNITVLTIADRKGSEQISGWVAPLKQRFGNRIDIRGVADVSTVPRILHGLVRTKFRKLQTYPVMMDWSGDTVKAFTCVPDNANLFLLDQRGQILKRISGEASAKRVEDLSAAIDCALTNHLGTLNPK